LNGYGTVSVPIPIYKNGSPDGIALVNPGKVIQFLVTKVVLATNGPAWNDKY
jgi:hypothetical protein